MAAQSPEALSRAVNALYRIRAVERPPGPDGLRSVWHQCAEGADLLSWVDERGHLVRQELTLLADYFCWTSQAGLVTGEALDARGSAGGPASADLRLDDQISAERVRRAARALQTYAGEDRYLRNVQRVLNLVLTGMQSFEEPTVTRAVPRAQPEAGSPPRKLSPPPASRHDRWTALGVGLAALLVAAALLVLGRMG